MGVTSPARSSNGSTTHCLRSVWIRKRLKDRGFRRLEDFADAVGISRQQLHRLLKGTYQPSAPTERQLAAQLGCLVDDLYEKATA